MVPLLPLPYRSRRMTMKKTFVLFVYDLFCGEVNDRFLQSGGVEIDPTWEDRKILRLVRKEWGPFPGLRIADISDDTILYLEDRKGNPVGELCPASMICQPWSR